MCHGRTGNRSLSVFPMADQTAGASQGECGEAGCGDYSVVFPEGNDEIGSLGKAFGKMSRAVEEREEYLRREMERRQQFIEAMTHEMNTPLTSIQGYAQFLLQANCTREQQQVALYNVEAEARRIRDMYQKLKELHLMQADGVKTELVRMPELMVEIREELGYLLEEKEMELKEYYPVQNLYTDRMLLYILLSNLIRNSINYSGRKAVFLWRCRKHRIRGCFWKCRTGDAEFRKRVSRKLPSLFTG